jgi:hypothetical protein
MAEPAVASNGLAWSIRASAEEIAAFATRTAAASA